MGRMRMFILCGGLLAALGCGGGGGGGGQQATGPVPRASTIVYTDPPATGWRLVKNVGASTAGRLVLDLWGPEGGAGYGVALNLEVDRAQFNLESVQNIAFDLGAEPQFTREVRVYRDQHIRMLYGAFQKGVQGPATAYRGPLARMTVSLTKDTLAGQRTELRVLKASALSSDGLHPVTVAVGSFSLQ